MTKSAATPLALSTEPPRPPPVAEAGIDARTSVPADVAAEQLSDARAETRSEERAAERERRIMLHMPVDVRSLSLGVLAVLAGIYMLHWASAVLIPIMMGVLFSYALAPVVDRLERWRLPRALGAGLLMIGIVGSLGASAWSLSDDAALLAESLPDAARKVQAVLVQRASSKESTIEIVQRAAQQLEQAALDNARPVPTARGVQRVQIERPRFNIKDYLWSGTVGALSAMGQAVMVIFIAYFLLVSGNIFRRKLVKLAGPRLSQKKITVQALDEITSQIQRYLIVQVATSALVGLATGLVFVAMGLNQAIVWGVLAGITNLIPYAGAIALTGGSALVAFMQFGTVDMAVAIGGASFAVHAVVGYLITPWLTSRASSMNPVVIFIAVLVWGWLWGVWGLLLGVPIMMVVKAVCDRVEDLKPIAELLEA